MSGKYDDIIDLPHPTSAKHPRMPVADRAAQFSPFAALTGYEAAVQETARLTDERIELNEDELAALDEKLRTVLAWNGEAPLVSITYFQADDRKAGGSYNTAQGYIRKLDELRRVIVMQDGSKIPVDDVLEISSKIFDTME